MKRGQVVSRRTTTSHTKHSLGAVLDTEIRNGWAYLQVQWVHQGQPIVPLDEKSEWVRVDELIFINPIEELKRVQDALTLSSALISENFAKVLEKENGRQ